jgi:hypothetical protein
MCDMWLIVQLLSYSCCWQHQRFGCPQHVGACCGFDAYQHTRGAIQQGMTNSMCDTA